MAERLRGSFDPHYWENCYVFRCRGKECPYIVPCFGAEKREKEEVEGFIESLNRRIFEGFDLGMLSPIERIQLNHAIEKHGVRFASQGKEITEKEGANVSIQVKLIFDS